MRRLGLVLAIVVLCAGCASVGWFRDALGDRQERRLTRAGELARDRQPSAARDLYEGLVREPSLDTGRAIALYKLGRLYTNPASGFLDYRAAQIAFERLLAEYPKSDWEADARAWHATLVEIQALEAEAAWLRDEATKLQADLQAREAEAARLRGEATKLKADLRAREAEAARLRGEATKVKADLQAREAEAARLKDETARLETDLERLKRIDMNFERRR